MLNEIPSKKQKSDGESRGGHVGDVTQDERLVFSRAELTQLIQEETDKKLRIELQQMEERILAVELTPSIGLL